MCSPNYSHVHVTPERVKERERERKRQRKNVERTSLSLEGRSSTESDTIPTISIRPKTISLYLDLPPSRTFSQRYCGVSRVLSRDYEIAVEDNDGRRS